MPTNTYVVTNDEWSAATFLRIRAFEEMLLTYSPKGFIHSSIGQEHSSILAAKWIKSFKEDGMAFTGHRPHALSIALGMTFEELLKEILRHPASQTHGKGCSMNFSASLGQVNVIEPFDNISTFEIKLVTSAKVGGACGMALGASRLKPTVAVIGDGASETGIFYESVNWMWDPEWSHYSRPLLILVEENGLAISHRVYNTPLERFGNTNYRFTLKPEEGAEYKTLHLDSAVKDVMYRNLTSTLVRIQTFRPYGHYYWEKRSYPRRNDWMGNIPELKYVYNGQKSVEKDCEKDIIEYKNKLYYELKDLFESYLGTFPDDNLMRLPMNMESCKDV